MNLLTFELVWDNYVKFSYSYNSTLLKLGKVRRVAPLDQLLKHQLSALKHQLSKTSTNKG